MELLIALKILADTFPRFCFGNVLLLLFIALFGLLTGLLWLAVPFGAMTALGLGYYLLAAPLPTPIERAIGRRR